MFLRDNKLFIETQPRGKGRFPTAFAFITWANNSNNSVILNYNYQPVDSIITICQSGFI